MTEHAVGIHKLCRNFGQIKALDNVSFTVKRQSIFGLLGPNGAGKTTLFSIAANFIHADSGQVEILGVDVQQIAQLQGRLSILPQDALFQRNVPILEQLVFFRLLDGRTRSEAVGEVKKTLEMVGLGEFMNRRVHSLSHGMIKRLGVAQAFLGNPEVILLDEPTSGLDPANARQIRDLIRELQSRATILISSHNLAEIQELCDHVAILDQGKLVAAGSVAEITRAGRKIDVRLSRPLLYHEITRLSAPQGIRHITDSGAGRYTFHINVSALEAGENEAEAMDQIIRQFLRDLLDMDLIPREFREGTSLEEHFLKVTGKGGD
ncbi:MAG: ABC transporter ATP-binding protein [Pirellulales bacterium]|nr:ABC transporter ATP-binding protein [Pirellulales bacterium]